MALTIIPWEDDLIFDWDEHNELEIWKHHVRCFEVEECFENPYRAAPHKKAKSEPEKYGDRYRITGKTNGGRKLFIIIQYKGCNVVRPITAFDSNSEK